MSREGERGQGRQLRYARELEQLMSRYRSGDLLALVGPWERWEHQAPRLSELDEDAARGLVDFAQRGGQLNELAASVDLAAAVKSLKQVLSPRHPPVRTRWELHPFCHQSLGRSRWLLERIGVGVTGVLLYVTVWERLEPEEGENILRAGALSALERPGVASWPGFSHVTDDIGTEYEPRGILITPFGPYTVTCGGSREVRTGRWYTEAWVPGPPSGAAELRLESGELRIDPGPVDHGRRLLRVSCAISLANRKTVTGVLEP